MGAGDFETAVELLTWAQHANDTHAANRAGYGDAEIADARSTPVADQRQPDKSGARPDALARWKHAKGYDVKLAADWPMLTPSPPTVLVGASWADLEPRDAGKGRTRNRVWLGETFPNRIGINEPRGRPLYGAALVTNDRAHRVGVIADPSTVPATPDGTHALVVAASSCWQIASALATYATASPERPARRYRSEALALQEHAAACVEAIPSSWSWAAELERQLEPVPPFAPILMPVQLRGHISVSSTQ